MKINNRVINRDNKPYIIAELSANHGGDLDRAKNSIKVAAKSGASAVKIQTYTPDTMTLNCALPDFLVKKKDFGLIVPSMIYIQKLIHLLSGTRIYSKPHPSMG